MKSTDFAPIFEKLTTCYGERMNNNVDTLNVYYLILKDLPTDLVQAAALDFMASNSAFPPAPGQIRGKAVELQKRGNNVPSSAEAWDEIQRAPARGYTWEIEGEEPEGGEAGDWNVYRMDYQFSHPLVEKVARNMGWPDRFWTDSLVSDRARFLQAYEQEMERATGEITSLPQVHQYLATGSGDMKSLMDGWKREAQDRGE